MARVRRLGDAGRHRRTCPRGIRARESTLPFRVTLLDFHSETYPGSRMAATYESRVRVEDPEQGAFERTISMNHPLHHRGYTLFQASYVEGEPRRRSVRVPCARAAPRLRGHGLLVGVGALWMSFFKRWVARRQGREALARLQPAAVSLAVFFASALGGLGGRWPTPGWRAPASVASRTADASSRSTRSRVSPPAASRARSRSPGRDGAGLDAVEWRLGLLSNPVRWQRSPSCASPTRSCARAVGLPARATASPTRSWWRTRA